MNEPFFLEKVFNAAAAAAAAAPTVAPPGTAEISRPRCQPAFKGTPAQSFPPRVIAATRMKRYRAEIKDEGDGGGVAVLLSVFSTAFFFFHTLIPETLGAGFPLLPLTISRRPLLLSLPTGSDGRAQPAERTGIRIVSRASRSMWKKRVRGSWSVRTDPSFAKFAGEIRIFFHPSPHRLPPPPAPTSSDRNPRRNPREDVSMSVFVGLPRQSRAR